MKLMLVGKYSGSLVVVAMITVALAVSVGARGEGGEVDAAPPGWEQQGYFNSYVLTDSHDVGGPSFNVPAHTPTTPSGLTMSNESALVPIGFPFTFYGLTYSNVYLVTNGYLAFGSTVSSFVSGGPLLTNAAPPVPAIFGHWAPLSIPDCGEVVYDVYGAAPNRVFVAEWNDICHEYSGSLDGITFQIKLFETTNVIEFHYFDVEVGSSLYDFGTGALAGIRNGSAGTGFLQYSWFQPALENHFAIRLWRPACHGEPAVLVGTRGDDDLWWPFSGAVYGHLGDDTITGNSVSQNLCGAEGNDVIRGMAGDDRLDGGPGDDRLVGGPGNDTASGGPGEDLIDGNGGADSLDGGEGADRIDGGGGLDTIKGGPGHDVLNGQGAADTISGGTGDLAPGSGNDIINGQAGADRIGGEDGHDTIKGQTGPDSLYGDPGNDALFGGDGNDELFGGPGTDTCAGNTGAGDMAEGSTCETTPGVEILF